MDIYVKKQTKLKDTDVIEGRKKFEESSEFLYDNGEFLRNQLIINKKSFFSDKPEMVALKTAMTQLNNLLSGEISFADSQMVENYSALIERQYDEVIECCQMYIDKYPKKINTRTTLAKQIKASAVNERKNLRRHVDTFIAYGMREGNLSTFAKVLRGTNTIPEAAEGFEYQNVSDDSRAMCAVSRLAAIMGNADLYESNFVGNKTEEYIEGHTADGLPIVTQHLVTSVVTKKTDMDFVSLDDLMVQEGISLDTYDARVRTLNGESTIEYSPDAIIQLRNMKFIDLIAGINRRDNRDILVRTEREGNKIVIKSVKAANMTGAFKSSVNGQQNLNVDIDATTIDAKLASALINVSTADFVYMLQDLLDEDQRGMALYRLKLIKQKLVGEKALQRLSGAALYRDAKILSANGKWFKKNNNKDREDYCEYAFMTTDYGPRSVSEFSERITKKRRLLQTMVSDSRKKTVRSEGLLNYDEGTDKQADSENKTFTYADDIHEAEWVRSTIIAGERDLKERLSESYKGLATVDGKVVIRDCSDEPLFEHVPDMLDIKQVKMGDCYLAASLLSVVRRNPQAIMDMMKDLGDRVAVRLFDPDGKPLYIEVKKTIAVFEAEISFTGKHMGKKRNEEYKLSSGNALWVDMFEKAFSQLRPTKYKGKSEIAKTDKLVFGDEKKLNKDGSAIEKAEDGGWTFIFNRNQMVIEGGIPATILGAIYGKRNLTRFDSAQRLHSIQMEIKKKEMLLSKVQTAEEKQKIKGAIDNIRKPVSDLKDAILDTLKANDTQKAVATFAVDNLMECLLEEEKSMAEMLRCEDIERVVLNMRKWPGFTQVYMRHKNVNENDIDTAIRLAGRAVMDTLEKSTNSIWEFKGRGESTILEEGERYRYSTKANLLFESLKKSLQRGPVTCGSRRALGKSDEKGNAGEKGLGGVVYTHAYSVVGVEEINGHKMVILQNPWGSGIPVYKSVRKADGEEEEITRRAVEYMDLHDMSKDETKQKQIVDDDKTNGIFYLDINDFSYYMNSISVASRSRGGH